MESSTRKHARYSGSNAHRFLKCAGQVRLADTLPEMPESEYAAEGTQAHNLLHDCLTENVRPVRGGRYPDEMCDGVQDVLSYVGGLRIQFPDLAVLSELQVIFPQSVVPAIDAAGFCDVFCISLKARRAWAIDFKYGVGEVVDVEGNAQALFYATAGVWTTAGIDTVTLVIIQPRTYMDQWLRESDVTILDLAEYAGEVEEAIEAAERPDAPLTPGDWCHWCPAAVVCPVAEGFALAPLEVKDVQDDLPEPSSIDIVRIGAIRSRADYIRGWLKQIEDYAYAQARSGVYVPGAKLVLAQGRRAWDDKGRATAEKLWEISGWKVQPDELMRYQVVGITEAEQKVIAAVKPNGKEAVAQAKREMAFLTTRSSSGNLILVDESDKRPAYRGAAADFAGVTIEGVAQEISGADTAGDDGRGLSAVGTSDAAPSDARLAPPTPNAMWFGAQVAAEPDVQQLMQEMI